MESLLFYGLYFLGFLALLGVVYKALGIVVVGDSEVGIVTKKISRKNLAPDKSLLKTAKQVFKRIR